MSTEALRYDILARDELSAALEKIARVAAKVDSQLGKVAKAGQETGEGLDKAEKSSEKLGRDMEQTGSRAERLMARLHSAGAAARGVGEHFEGAARAARTGFSVIGTGVGLLGGAAATAAVTLGGIGLKSAAGIETATITFTTLLKSGEKAKKFMGDLQRFAAATPFELPGLQTAASQMLAAGFAAKDVIPLLTRLGNATAAMGTGSEGIDRATYALNQMRAAGRVTAEDMNQLTDAGILGWDALAAQMHKSQKEVRDLVSAGKVPPDTLFAAILNGKGQMANFAGMMDKQSQTLSGMWSSFKDNASQALAALMAPFVPGAKTALGWVAENIPKLVDKAKEFGDKLKEIFAGMHVGDDLKDIWKSFNSDDLQAAKESVKDLFGVIRDHKAELKQVLEMMTTGFAWLASDVLPDAIDALRKTISFVSGAVDAFNWLSRMADIVFQGILNSAVIAFGWIPGIGPKLKQAQQDFQQFRMKVNDEIERIHQNIPVTLHVGVTYQGGAQQIMRGRAIAGLASGGPVDPGQVIRVGEHGPETLLVGPGGKVLTNQQTNAMAGGTSDVEVVAPLVLVMEGQTIWQGMLRFKRRTGKASLGLA